MRYFACKCIRERPERVNDEQRVGLSGCKTQTVCSTVVTYPSHNMMEITAGETAVVIYCRPGLPCPVTSPLSLLFSGGSFVSSLVLS